MVKLGEGAALLRVTFVNGVIFGSCLVWKWKEWIGRLFFLESVDKYVVNPDTMALLPINGPQGELWTLALETNAHVKITMTPFKIIDYSCIYFGSTYAGRKGSASLMGYKKSALSVFATNWASSYFLLHLFITVIASGWRILTLSTGIAWIRRR
ncbi:competence protein ComK [Terrilactibacillus sp. S3-3]|nr:competence protein ComK [Terrilactibacillus sp. S3-3]